MAQFQYCSRTSCWNRQTVKNNLEHFPLVDTFYIDLQLFKIKKAFRRSSEWFASVSKKVFCLLEKVTAESCLFTGKNRGKTEIDTEVTQ